MTEFTTYSLCVKNDKLFEVVKASDGTFLSSPGFATEKEAVVKATALAKKYTNEEFWVYAPIKAIKADISVTVVSFKE